MVIRGQLLIKQIPDVIARNNTESIVASRILRVASALTIYYQGGLSL